MLSRPQRTLKKEVFFSGIGIHTGKEVSLHFCPAPENSGIVFKRVDLEGQPVVPAALDFVQDTNRSTTIGSNGCSIQTVEHVLAALYAYQIDNLCVKLSEGEPPVGDGSSNPFVKIIQEAGIVTQTAQTKIRSLKEPVYFSNNSVQLVALPSDEYRISYTLHYPQIPLIRSQFLSIRIDQESFTNEIASCRTFALHEEITTLMELGLIRGGSLENAVVIKDNVVLSKEGLRYPDEMVRHKILDLVGDLSLIGFPFAAHIIAIRSGHQANIAFGKELAKHFAS